MSFDFSQSFSFQFRASRYTTGHNRTSKSNVIVVWFFLELPVSIPSVSLYYETQSDTRVKSYCRLNLVRDSTFNFEHLNILRDSIKHPNKNVIGVWICTEFLFSITSLSIFYGTQSDIRMKSYCRWNLLRPFVFNFECLDILWVSIEHPSKKLLSFEFALSFFF